MRKQQLIKLARVATVIKDVKLQELAKAQEACAQTRMLLQELGDSHTAQGQASIQALIVADHHDQWRLQRRIALNQALAKKTAAMLDAKDRAATAFSRADVLAKLVAPKR